MNKMLNLWPKQQRSTNNMRSSSSNSIPMIAMLRHICSLFYQLFIIISVTLITCTLNVRHGAFAYASAVSTASSSSSSSAATAAESNYDLHAAHISIDSIMMTVDNNNDLSHLTFEPNFLHFDELSVGETANKVVTIFNRHANRSVYLGSISGSVSDFYSSFFEENLVAPMGNTTFNVVFLPRQQAIIKAHLIIHTSFGVLNYEVNGKGVECPYRLSPLVGLKAPMNATLMPEIHMYNPYDTPLQIVEVYSSGGKFQLELPTNDDRTTEAMYTASTAGNNHPNAAPGNTERSQALWEIPPYCSKPVIRVRFTATHVGNSTAYIRIKVSTRKNSALEKAVIVLPIEVEIFKEHGIYSTMPFLDFGLSGTDDRPKSVTFRLQNSGNEPYEIVAYSIEADENVRNGITLEINAVHDDTENKTYHKMTATVNWSRISAEQFFRGNIVIQTRRKHHSSMAETIKSKGGHLQYRVPFVGGILRGSIQYNDSLTRFHQPTIIDNNDVDGVKSIRNNQIVRDFRLKNNFDVALAITNLTMSSDTLLYFRAKNFKSELLSPGEESIIFQIVQQPAAAMQSVIRSFYLHTNVSIYDIELFSFNGLLKRLLPVVTDHTHIDHKPFAADIDEKSINFGILPLSTLSQIQLALVNRNPIPINIHNWKGTISSAAHIGITVPGCSKLTMKGLKFCNIVKPGEWIVFQIGVTSNTVGSFEGKFTVQTDYEIISTPIRFSTDMGILKFTTKLVDTESCFPGGICKVNLTAYSTFTRSMQIKTIQASNICLGNDLKTDNAVQMQQDVDGHDECHVMNLSRLGNVSDLVTPFVIYEDGDQPLIAAQDESFIDQLEIAVPRICDEHCTLDAEHVAQRNDDSNSIDANRQRFLLLKKQLQRFHALSAKFQRFTFHVQTNHIKRYDFNGSIDIVWPKLVKGPIEFDISQVGHELTKHIDIHNPFDAALQIHYHIHDVERFNVDINLPADIIDECTSATITEDSVFSLDNRRKQSDIVIIPPKTYQKISVKFMSDNPGTYGTVLYIRNNVTVLEAVWITAKSVVPQFKFGNRKPGSKTPLLFELTDKHLRDCNHPNTNMRAVSAKRTFTAKNSGEVPIYMRELRIDDLPCEGYGYRILECAPFELPPNGSRKIEIAFTPDFTLAMVKKTLYLDTSLNYSVNYTLLSMIAPLSLSVCSKALARPEWESLMKNVTAAVLAVSFVCVLFAAYLDSMKVLKVHVENMSKAKGSLQPALDLRQIGLRSLFSEENATKSGSTTTLNSTSSPGTSSPTASNNVNVAVPTTATTKQNLQSNPLMTCNAKANGSSICKKKTTDKKRTSSCTATDLITPRKSTSYITEIAKKFTPKKSDMKQIKAEQSKVKNSPPPPSSSSSASSASSTSSTSHNNSKKDKRPKDESPNTNYEEEETSSTTTESSTHSDDKLSNAKSKNLHSQSKDLVTVMPQSKDKKHAVKKSKSLPMNYESQGVENVPSTMIDNINSSRSHHNNNNNSAVETLIDEHLNSFDTSNTLSDDSYASRAIVADNMFSVLSTPPSNKTAAMKMINGKTPGRERTRANDIMPYRKSLDADNSAYKSTAFEFSSPLTDPPHRTIGTLALLDSAEKSSLYEHQYNHNYRKLNATAVQNGASIPLSSVLKHPITTTTTAANKVTNSKSANKSMTVKSKIDTKPHKDRRISKKQSTNEPFSNHSSFENLMSNDGKVSSPGVDLGPIGTRKSPSSTPIWEPMHSIQNPIPINTTNSLNNLAGSTSNSFFTDLYSQPSSAAAPVVAATASSSSSSSSSSTTYQRNDNTLNDMLNQHQINNGNDQFNHYRHHQQQQNAEMLRLLGTMYGQNNLDQHKQNLWDSTILLNIIQQQQQQQQQQLAQQRLQNAYSTAPNSLWNTGNVFDVAQPSPSTSYWSSVTPAVVTNEIRPPPGFGHPTTTTTTTAVRDQRNFLAQQQLNFQQYQQQQIQRQQMQTQQQQNQTTQNDGMQPYDIFNSLSSIWSSDNSWNNQNNDPNKKTK